MVSGRHLFMYVLRLSVRDVFICFVRSLIISLVLYLFRCLFIYSVRYVCISFFRQ